jgi:8-oxo-dGTP diphosphatase
VGCEDFCGQIVSGMTHDYPEKSVRLKFFLCELISGEPQPLDCAAVKWIQKSQLTSLQFPAADAQLLVKLKLLPF